MKRLMFACLIVTLSACSPATPNSPGTPSAAPGTPAGATGTTKGPAAITTLTNAEWDLLIACAKSKGPSTATFVTSWEAQKRDIPEGPMRAEVKPTVESQAKAIGCLGN